MEIPTLSMPVLSPSSSPAPPILACVMFFLAGDTSSIPFSSPSASAPCYGDTLCLEQT